MLGEQVAELKGKVTSQGVCWTQNALVLKQPFHSTAPIRGPLPRCT